MPQENDSPNTFPDIMVPQPDALTPNAPTIQTSDGLPSSNTGDAYEQYQQRLNDQQASLDHQRYLGKVTEREEDDKNFRQDVRVLTTIALLALAFTSTAAGTAVALKGDGKSAVIAQHDTGLQDASSQAGSATPETPKAPALPEYKEVVIHHAQLKDTVPTPKDIQQNLVPDVEEALQALDKAFKGKRGLGDLPITEKPEVRNLPDVGLQDVEGFDISPKSSEILDALDLKKDALDVVVVNAPDDAPLGIPLAHADSSHDDIVIYNPEKVTSSVMAHELNHILAQYAHDQRYEVTPNGTTIILGSDTPWKNYGNGETIAGDVRNRPATTDPDMVTGYEMLRVGAITPNQVQTVNTGETLNTKIDAVSSDSDTPKLIVMPLQPNTLHDADAIMLELSHEGNDYTLKAYGTGEIAEDGVELGATFIIPLDSAQNKMGLGAGDLKKQITIKVGSEDIKLTLMALNTDAKNATAQVTISRS